MKITKTMTIKEVIDNAPHAGKILFEAGMHCIGCHMMTMETLEEGCKAHEMNDKEIDELVKKINESF